MSDSVLNQIALSCDPVWNRSREAQAYLLRVQSLPDCHADGQHLARVLRESHPPSGPVLLIQPDTPALLCGLLEAVDAPPGPLVAEQAWLADPAVLQALQRSDAAARPVLLRAPPGAELPPGLERRFLRWLVAPELRHMVVLMALVTDARPTPLGGSGLMRQLGGQWIDGVASARLAAWCLDQASVHGVVGWPVDEALLNARGSHTGFALPVDRRVVQDLLLQIDRDAALESLGDHLCADPVLAWRFLRFVNSAGLALRAEIETVRHGLMMVGARNLRQWLEQLLPSGSDEADLRPLREVSVLCSRLTAELVDAGTQMQLAEELSLCGLFAELGPLAGEPLPVLLAQLPLPARVRDAILHERAPYGPYLAVARAQLRRTPSVVAACKAHGLPLEDANRALLRVLATQPAPQRLQAAALAR